MYTLAQDDLKSCPIVPASSLTKSVVKMCLVSGTVADSLQTASAGALGQGCAGISSLLQRPGNGSCPSRCQCMSSMNLVYPDSGAFFQREAALHFPPNPLIYGAGLTSFL